MSMKGGQATTKKKNTKTTLRLTKYPEGRSNNLKKLAPFSWGIHQWLLLQTKYFTSWVFGFTQAHCRYVFTWPHGAHCHHWGDHSLSDQLMAPTRKPVVNTENLCFTIILLSPSFSAPCGSLRQQSSWTSSSKKCCCCVSALGLAAEPAPRSVQSDATDVYMTSSRSWWCDLRVPLLVQTPFTAQFCAAFALHNGWTNTDS